MNATTANSAPLSGPGAQLAQARTDLHWSQEEVAARLHLSTRQIQALEEDNYASLPGPTYARGYLKSYALLLGLSPDVVLDAHTRLTAKPVQQDFSTITPPREITSHHHQIRFTTYLLVTIVLGLAVAWWVGSEPRPPATLTAVPETGTPAAPPDAMPPPQFADPEPRPEITAPARATVPAAVPAPVAPAVAPAPVAVEPRAEPLPTGPRASLVLHADQDAWADIRDARQVKLLYETVPAGRSVTLEGVAPFSVFLGNPGGTRLEFNGQPVDVARHKRGLVARFILGEIDSEGAVAPDR